MYLPRVDPRLAQAEEVIRQVCLAYPWLKPSAHVEKQQSMVSSSHGKKAGDLVRAIHDYCKEYGLTP